MAEVRLLVPLDGSALAEKAVEYVQVLKPLGDLNVRLVSAVDTPEGAHAGSEGPLTEYLETQAQRLKAAGIGAAIEVRHGAAATAIVEAAERYAPELIVISTHGRSGFQRWRMGSVADKVIRGSNHNVLVIGPNIEARELQEAPRTVLAPLDGSELAEAALSIADRYAAAFGATLHLVEAVNLPVTAGDITGYTYTPELIDSLNQGASAYLAEKAAKCSAQKVTAVMTGPAASEIERYVKANSIDLVVMTTHGRGGLVRSALGSVTDRLIGATAAPVLVVRSAPQEAR